MNENYSKLVDIAFNMHKSGKLDDAKTVYEKLLSISPDDIDVINLYAQLNFSLKNYELAFDLFKKVYDKTNLPDIAAKVALVAFNLKKFEIAIDYYKKILEKNNDFSANFYASLSYKELKQFDKSIEYALNAYAIKNNELDVCLHLAYLYEMSDNLDLAIQFLDNALKIDYNEQIIYNMAILFKKQKKYQDAIFCFEKVLELNPNNKNAMLNIANTYKHINMDDSLDIYKQIEKIFPDDQQVKFFIYNIYFDMFDFDNAMTVAKKLLELDSNNVDYYKMLGDCYYSIYDYEQAFECYKKGESISPDDKIIKMSLAEIHYVHQDYDRALEYVNSAGYTVNDFTDISLKKRELEPIIERFVERHVRKKDPEVAERKAKMFFYKLNLADKYNVTEEYFVNQKLPVMDNKELVLKEFYKKIPKLNTDFHGKNVLIYSVHGIGDFIMFSRYALWLKEIANSILLYIPKTLERIVRQSFPFAKIYLNGESVPDEEYDYAFSEFVSMCFTTKTLKSIPYSTPYFKVSDDLVIEKSLIVKSDDNKKKIGVFWQGNPTVLLNRSIKLKYFLPLFENKNAQFYSFQISDIDEESHKLKKTLPIIDLQPHINDYADTAALLKNMDLLITIDTSIANLAGALGIKTYLLLPYDSEWRWFTDDESTPWYESVKIFKQKIPNDWNQVISRVKDEIEL